MNWKLIFNKSGAFVELYDTKGKVILNRAFLGFVREDDSNHIRPKFALLKDERVSQNKITGDLIFKSNKNKI